MERDIFFAVTFVPIFHDKPSSVNTLALKL